MATRKNVATVVDSVSVENETLENVLERLVQADKQAHNETQGILSLFIEKAANVLANEKSVARLNTCYAKLYKLNNKKLARQFVNAFTVLSSKWARSGKKLATVPDTASVQFTKDNKLHLMTCNDANAFATSWAYHKQAIEFNQTNLINYVSSVKVEKVTQDKGIDDIKKAISTLYKGASVDGKKFLADFMREKGIDIPTF